MAYLNGTAERVVDDEFPGWVEVRFSGADGAENTLVEKLPVLDGDLTTASKYPASVRIPCRVVKTEANGTVAVVELEHEATDLGGRNVFRVPADAVITGP
ncbi:MULTISPECIES: hypothetical protein [Amycolatopsis]|uniref:Uncharacterized protein n=1 Tax=Amycolatopsis dendrobii TaxID=2760662 RepID=A0A7W3ZEW9_9PSEU|nr:MULTISPECIES: hypothetical protein [Amycolatopsis]MBB1159011.1 hypothetical protein [Amycolatopsis dendrobii]UKD52631.1 hypothetical protein L3Q65_32645 [Amycolatopsis sp. FU40]